MQVNGSNSDTGNPETKTDKESLRKMLRKATAEYKQAKVQLKDKRREVKALRRSLKKRGENGKRTS